MNACKRVVKDSYRFFLCRRYVMAANMYVRCVEGDDKIQISFNYSHNGSESRTFNALRPQNEEISRGLERIAANVSKKVVKKKRKLTEGESQIMLKALSKNEEEIPASTTMKDALVEGNIVTINGLRLVVEVNAPSCLGLTIPDSIMAGFPIYPKIDIEFADLHDCEFNWEKIKYQSAEPDSGAASAGEHSKKEKQSDISIKTTQSVKVSDRLVYTPNNEDIDYYLKLTCLPKSGERLGKFYSTESKFVVTAGPGLCPFQHRHLYTNKVTGKDEFRVVSYNILADLYADSDFSRTELYPYCPPYALSIDYRKHLIIKELTGYNSDIICLQEVDRKVYLGELMSVFETEGFDSSFKAKGGQVVEGSAIFYRTSKFRFLEQYDVIVKDVLETEPYCEDILEKVYTVEALKQVVESRTTALHIVALEPVDKPGRVLLVANTHYYFHPNACHVRLIQNLVCVRYIENLLKQYGKKMCSLVFCGDFNSAPHRGIYEFMTKRHISEDHAAWKEAPPDQFIGGMNFSHDLNLDSGCGIVPYTNYTAGFHAMLDYIYYDLDTLEVIQVIPPPDHKDVEFHVALPSIVFPSDHIAQICDFKFNF